MNDKIVLISISEEHISDIIINALKKYDESKMEGKPEPLYSINKASKLLGVSWATVRKYIAENRIRTVKENLIPESAIREFMQNQ